MIDCNNCPHLSIIEEQQERLWRSSNKMAMLPHICTKYNQRVLHYPYREPMIHPCQQCEEEKEKTIIEYTYNKVKEFKNYELAPEYKQRLEEYYKKIENDFQAEWSKKKFKWFFKKHRQKKLRTKIARRYSGPVFWLIEDIMDDIFSNQWQDSEYFGKFVDVKDVALGDKNYFVEEKLMDKINSFGCTSFNLTPDEIKQLNTPTLDPSHPCYGCCHYEGCGYFDFYDGEKTEEENMAENCAGCCCGDGWECNKHSDYGCLNYEIEPNLG